MSPAVAHDTHLMLKPVVEVSDMAGFKELMKEKIKVDDACGGLYTIPSFRGNECHVLEGYGTLEDFIRMMQAAKELHASIGQKSTFELEVHGPADTAGSCAKALKEEKVPHERVYSLHEEGAWKTKVPTKDNIFWFPHFKVHKPAEFLALTKLSSVTAKEEPGMLLFGFTVDATHKSAQSRQAWTTAEALRRHVESSGEHIKRILGDKTICELTKVTIHGPKTELEKLGDLTKRFDAHSYFTD